MTTNGTEKRPLPDGWTWTTLGEVADPGRNRVKPQDFAELLFIGMDDVESETMRLLGTKPSSEMKSSSEHFWPDDVLYGSLRPYLNKVYRPDFEGLCSAEFIVFRNTPHLKSKYLQYFLNQWSFVAFINKQNTGDRPRVKFQQMEDYPFPLPPLPEQERIVAEIEKQFTRLDQAVASLRRLQSNLARYKASVLKAACDGRLVPQDPADEPADQLLARILAERRAQWQAVNPGKKYKEPVGVEGETAVLPEFPSLTNGWIWATAEQLSNENRSVTYGVVKLGEEVENGVPTLRSSNVRHLSLDTTFVKKISPKIADNYRRTYLEGGEILVTVRGTLGGVVVVPDECKKFNISREVAMIALVEPRIGPAIQYFMASQPIQNWLNRRTRGIAYTGINIATLKQTPIPLPPLAEQERIVAEVERRLSVVTAVEQTITANLSRAERLRQSILHRAFTGQLVPQEGVA